MHTRTVECRGYLRDDGLWDIEGHLIDTKPFAIPNEDRGGEIPAGEPLHEMWIRLTVDTDLVVHDVEVCTDHSPYSVCGDIVENFKALKGSPSRPGGRRRPASCSAGPRDARTCVELLGPVATTAFQTVYPARIKRDKHRAAYPSARAHRFLPRVRFRRADRLRRWPQFYTGSK